MSLYWKVNAYLEANGKTDAEFTDNIRLQNDGSGDYIHTWNISGLVKPTEEQLTAVDSDATAHYNTNRIDKTRRGAYGDWKKQLDQLYHDMTAGKLDATGEWYKSIKKVKDDNPKG